jgi:hypothetical protein
MPEPAIITARVVIVAGKTAACNAGASLLKRFRRRPDRPLRDRKANENPTADAERDVHKRTGNRLYFETLMTAGLEPPGSRRFEEREEGGSPRDPASPEAKQGLLP